MLRDKGRRGNRRILIEYAFVITVDETYDGAVVSLRLMAESLQTKPAATASTLVDRKLPSYLQKFHSESGGYYL